ncbi:MAG TPA: 2-succinyl-5-enolpyruvyl-6-hydroxy-3-cyclohexene-1-carboxylic-acid synthase [Cyclobacteriaceae bacterium]|nr:2-succinyl-5-enolpyruvyl-6-hydroxy-3-cyclohexene-1-carboxylic-acid synthase [Cyclobacteriaceae bacterium]
MLPQLIELCYRKGIREAVLCPGSRSAPLTLAFARQGKIHCRTISDERSAAFMALGMAQASKQPVALVCTSGSAAYNFAPAVAEAYFQQIPLVVFTADRPAEWIDQLDGQTIRQGELYGKHVKKYFELPLDYVHPDARWFANRIINEAINLATTDNQGPVHVNAPFREPLYNIDPPSDTLVRVIDKWQPHSALTDASLQALLTELKSFKRILIVAGQQDYDAALLHTLRQLHEHTSWVVAGDILSNLHGLSFFCRSTDAFLGQLTTADKSSLQPDLLITFGKSVIAKNLKLFLRAYPAKQHWHLQAQGESADTYQQLKRIIPVEAKVFFQNLLRQILPKGDKAYEEQWTRFETQARATIKRFLDKQDGGEFKLIYRVMTSLPIGCHLHLANSMSVRYANHIGLATDREDVVVYANRGTSGIDGCTSTATGHAWVTQAPVVLITGDLAFFYDRNAFWHNYTTPNLRVVLINNHGGIIFNLIDGPARQPEAPEFFITEQKLNARSLAREFNLAYHDASAELSTYFGASEQTSILEIEGSQEANKKIFEEFRHNLKLTYGA